MSAAWTSFMDGRPVCGRRRTDHTRRCTTYAQHRMRPTLTGIEVTLADAGGVGAPRERAGQLRTQLAKELEHGARELPLPRAGYEHPVVVAVAPHDHGLVAVLPVAPELRADPDAVDERAWLLSAALVGALVDAADPATATLTAGTLLDGHLALHLRA